MANNTRAPFGAFGREYAAGLAGAFSPRLDFLRGRQARVKSPEAIQAEMSGLFQGAIESGGQVGEDVARVGQTGLSAAAGLAGALPGMDLGFLSDAARSTGRAGAGAAVMGRALTSQAQQALAQAILSGQRMADETRMGLESEEAGVLSEQAAVEADWLAPAMQRQGMAMQAQQIKMLRAELKNVPIARRAMVLGNMLQRGQIESVDLQNEMMRKELSRLGVSAKDIARIGKKGKGKGKDKSSGTGGVTDGRPQADEWSTPRPQ
jgi:hypothetical protein